MSESGIHQESHSDQNGKSTDNLIKLRREVGLLEGTAITIGSIIGSGIFVSPKGVIENSGSVGLSLLIWVLCGFQATLGALCYAELGTGMPSSGGDYHYLYEAFGPVPAFMHLWVSILISIPTTNAILSLTFAQYTFASFFPTGCVVPKFAVQLMAACAILFLTWINCVSVRLTTKLQNVFMFGKISALLVIIITGLLAIFQGNIQNYEHIWEGSSLEPGKIALAFYSGTFAYSGWNTLNFMTEELKEPNKNLPRSIYISLPIVIIIYVLTNVAYFSVLSPTDIKMSTAIAVTFGERVLGFMKWTIPIFVAMSSFGGLSVHIMTSSRVLFVGARNGHFPSMLALIQTSKLSPTTSLVFMGILSLIYLCIPDVFVLINFSTFVFSLVCLAVVIAMIYLRWKRPIQHPHVKVHLICPILFLGISIFLTVFPILIRPAEVLTALGILITSLPVYAIFIAPASQPRWLVATTGTLTASVQKLFLSLPEDRDSHVKTGNEIVDAKVAQVNKQQ